MAFSTQHFCYNLTRPELRGSIPHYLRTFMEQWFGDLAQLCCHKQQRHRTYPQNYPAWLTPYGNRRNVNIDASSLDSCLRYWRFGGFTDAG